MIDWKRLGIAVLCTAILVGGCIVIIHLPIEVLLAFIVVAFVCALTLAFYMLLDDILEKDYS